MKQIINTCISLDSDLSGYKNLKPMFVLPIYIIDAIRNEYSNNKDFINCCNYVIHMISEESTANIKGYDYRKFAKFIKDNNLMTLTRNHANFHNFSRTSLYCFNVDSNNELYIQLESTKENTNESDITTNIPEKQRIVIEHAKVDLHSTYVYMKQSGEDINKIVNVLNDSIKFNEGKRFASFGTKCERLYSSLTALNESARKYLYLDEYKKYSDNTEEYNTHYFNSYDIKTAQPKLLALYMKENGYEIDDQYIQDVFFNDFYTIFIERILQCGYNKLTSNAQIEINGKKTDKIYLGFHPQMRNIIKQPIISEIFFGNKTSITDAVNGGRYVISTAFRKTYPKVYKFITEYRKLKNLQTKELVKNDIKFNEYKESKNKSKMIERYNELKITMASDFQTFESDLIVKTQPNALMFTVHDSIYFIDNEKQIMFDYLNQIINRFKLINQNITTKQIFHIKIYEPMDLSSEECNVKQFITESKRLHKQHKSHQSKSTNTELINSINEMLSKGLSKSAIALKLNITRVTLNKILK